MADPRAIFGTSTFILALLAYLTTLLPEADVMKPTLLTILIICFLGSLIATIFFAIR